MSATSNGNHDSTNDQVNINSWPGWVELESEPAFFNVILRDIGVRGVKVQEVFGLGEELSLLAQPVHALIFLFKYKDAKREDLDADFPQDVWFARQTAGNACASFALINIINNISGLHLGRKLADFKNDTSTLNPLERGHAIDQLDFLRATHNSFASGNDLIARDQYLLETIEAARKEKAAKAARETRAKRAALNALKKHDTSVPTATRASERLKTEAQTSVLKRKHDLDGTQQNKRAKVIRKASQRRKSGLDEDDAAYHFCAYMPINDHTWKLDGLEPTPQDLGSCITRSWLDIAVDALQARIAQYDQGALEFNLMAVVHDPLETSRKNLITNVVSLRAVEKRLAVIAEDWWELDDQNKADLIKDFNLAYDISPMDLLHVQLPEPLRSSLDQDLDMMALLELRKKLIQQQISLRAATRDELLVARDDEEKAFHRRHDYAGFVRSWLADLIEEDRFEEIMYDISTQSNAIDPLA